MFRFNKKILGIICIVLIIIITGCGYSEEEYETEKQLKQQATENAKNYIKEKYELNVNVTSVQLKYHTDKPFGNSFNGYALVSCEYNSKEFQVYIRGNEVTNDGSDNYQLDEIKEDTLTFINNITGLKPYKSSIYYGEYFEYSHKEKDMKYNGLIKEKYTRNNLEEIINNNNFMILIGYINERNLEFIKNEQLFKDFKKMRILFTNYLSLNDYNKVHKNDRHKDIYERGNIYNYALNIESYYDSYKGNYEVYEDFDMGQLDDVYYYTRKNKNIILTYTDRIDQSLWVGHGVCKDGKKIYKDFQFESLNKQVDIALNDFYVYIPINEFDAYDLKKIKLGVLCNDYYKMGDIYTTEEYLVGSFQCNNLENLKFTLLYSPCQNK